MTAYRACEEHGLLPNVSKLHPQENVPVAMEEANNVPFPDNGAYVSSETLGKPHTRAVVESAWLVLLATARAAPPAAEADWYTAIAEAAAPLLHGIVAAGSEQCENLKKLLGLSYEQVQIRNTPDTEASLTLNQITRSRTQKFNISSVTKSIMRGSDFDSSKKLVILIHGFMENAEGMMVQAIAEEFLKRDGYNILALDGGDMVKTLYFRSSTYARFMGEKLGEVLAELDDEGYNPKDIIVIGHSLGAHVAGISGKAFTRLTGRRLGRITGLDPAGPCFSNVEDGAKLQKGDAEYVDVIHTDGGLLGLKEPMDESFFLATPLSTAAEDPYRNHPPSQDFVPEIFAIAGDQDYFPNGGSLQPGCGLPPCSHSRAWMLYAESARDPTAFPATLCSDWSSFRNGSCAGAPQTYMGAGSAPSVAGSYFLVTGPIFKLDEGYAMTIS